MRGLVIALLSIAFVFVNAQDEFPPMPDEVLLKAGIMSPTMAKLSWEAQARRVFSDVFALVGLGDQVEGAWGPATGPAGEERLRKVLANESMILALLHDIPGGFMNGLSPEAKVLEVKLLRAFDLIPKLLSAQSADVVPDIPETRFIYEGLANLMKEGFVKDNRPGRYNGFLWSRLAIAAFVRRALDRLPEVATKFRREAQSSSATSSMSEALKTLEMLADRYGTELRILGADPVALHSRIASVFFGPFPDVPANHWAANAVEALHARGLLAGYPSGKFGG